VQYNLSILSSRRHTMQVLQTISGMRWHPKDVITLGGLAVVGALALETEEPLWLQIFGPLLAAYLFGDNGLRFWKAHKARAALASGADPLADLADLQPPAGAELRNMLAAGTISTTEMVTAYEELGYSNAEAEGLAAAAARDLAWDSWEENDCPGQDPQSKPQEKTVKAGEVRQPAKGEDEMRGFIRVTFEDSPDEVIIEVKNRIADLVQKVPGVEIEATLGTRTSPRVVPG